LEKKFNRSPENSASHAAFFRNLLKAELARTKPQQSGVHVPERQASVNNMMSIVTSLPKLPFRDDEDPTAFLYDDLGLPRRVMRITPAV
jgi:hypothetical protein